MHYYCNKLLSKYFDDYFIPISLIQSYSIRLSTSNPLFLAVLHSSLGKYLLTFVGS